MVTSEWGGDRRIGSRRGRKVAVAMRSGNRKETMMNMEAIRRSARDAADLHGTEIGFELYRLARELGHPTWSTLLESLLNHVASVAIVDNGPSLSTDVRTRAIGELRLVDTSNPVGPIRTRAPEPQPRAPTVRRTIVSERRAPEPCRWSTANMRRRSSASYRHRRSRDP